MVKVYDTVSKETFIFPMLPERVKFKAETNFISYDLMNIGEVKVPSGELLSLISFEGILPGAKRKNAPFVSNWRSPSDIQSLFSIWRNEGRKLRLTVEGTPINHGVYLESYEVDYEGGMGDYTYSISFVAAKEISVGKADSKATTYVTVPGDTLWSIAQKTGTDVKTVKKTAKADKKTGKVPPARYISVSNGGVRITGSVRQKK